MSWDLDALTMGKRSLVEENAELVQTREVMERERNDARSEASSATKRLQDEEVVQKALEA